MLKPLVWGEIVRVLPVTRSLVICVLQKAGWRGRLSWLVSNRTSKLQCLVLSGSASTAKSKGDWEGLSRPRLVFWQKNARTAAVCADEWQCFSKTAVLHCNNESCARVFSICWPTAILFHQGHRLWEQHSIISLNVDWRLTHDSEWKHLELLCKGVFYVFWSKSKSQVFTLKSKWQNLKNKIQKKTKTNYTVLLLNLKGFFANFQQLCITTMYVVGLNGLQ